MGRLYRNRLDAVCEAHNNHEAWSGKNPAGKGLFVAKNVFSSPGALAESLICVRNGLMSIHDVCFFFTVGSLVRLR